MDAGFRTYLAGAGLSEVQIGNLTVDQLLTARRQYQQSLGDSILLLHNLIVNFSQMILSTGEIGAVSLSVNFVV